MDMKWCKSAFFTFKPDSPYDMALPFKIGSFNIESGRLRRKQTVIAVIRMIKRIPEDVDRNDVLSVSEPFAYICLVDVSYLVIAFGRA